MTGNARKWMLLFVILAQIGFFGCAGEEKEAKLELMDSEFSIRQESEYDYVIDAKGIIRNVGEVDVKNVEVTGYCRSCGEELIDAQWFISDYEKMAHQKDVISYLSAGSQEDFEFEEVAFYSSNKSQKPPEQMPENLEIVVESYQVVE